MEMYLIYHGFIKSKGEKKLMIKRILSVIGVIFLHFLIMFIGTIGFQILGEGRLPLSEDQIMHYSATFGTAFAALFACWFSHVNRTSGDLDLRREKNFFKMLAASVLAVCIVPILADSFLGLFLNGIFPIADDVSPEKTLFDYITVILIAPVVEEYFIRKGLYGYAREKIKIPAALIITSLIFAMLHGYNLQGFFSTFYTGIFLTLIYEHSGNIMYSICAHMTLNLFVNIVNALNRNGVHLFYNLNGYDIFTLPVLLMAVLVVTIILIKGRMEVGKRKIQSTCG